MLDRQIAPLGRRAMAVLAPQPGERVIDIGCGCGDTTLDLARAVGPAGRVLGVDVSAPMLAVAAERSGEAGLTQAGFQQVDAAALRVEAPFDAAFSRFGVMFFADPLAAFVTIGAGLRPGGRLVFVCWRAAEENPWMMVPLQAAAHVLPEAAPGDPLAPGPFAFADAARVRGILCGAGFRNVTVDAFDTAIGGFDLDEATRLALRVGPLGAALRDAPELGPAVKQAVRAALAGFQRADGVFLESATWIVSAAR
jgi:SAM-dependent methyltransferase